MDGRLGRQRCLLYGIEVDPGQAWLHCYARQGEPGTDPDDRIILPWLACLPPVLGGIKKKERSACFSFASTLSFFIIVTFAFKSCHRTMLGC